MRDLFPIMTERPRSKSILLGCFWWLVYLILLPLSMGQFYSDSYLPYGWRICRESAESWFPVSMGDIFVKYAFAYWIINGAAVLVIFWRDLKDSVWNLRLQKKNYLKSVSMGLLMLALAEIPILLLGFHSLNQTLNSFSSLPAADTLEGISSQILILYHPVLAIVCLLTLVPVTMCCMYYAIGFAPVARRKPWLGYLTVALLAALPAAMQFVSLDAALGEAIAYYLCLLPLHMCACWVYQKSDTIWGPILFHTAANLAGILIFVFQLPAGTLTF